MYDIEKSSKSLTFYIFLLYIDYILPNIYFIMTEVIKARDSTSQELIWTSNFLSWQLNHRNFYDLLNIQNKLLELIKIKNFINALSSQKYENTTSLERYIKSLEVIWTILPGSLLDLKPEWHKTFKDYIANKISQNVWASFELWINDLPKHDIENLKRLEHSLRDLWIWFFKISDNWNRKYISFYFSPATNITEDENKINHISEVKGIYSQIIKIAEITKNFLFNKEILRKTLEEMDILWGLFPCEIRKIKPVWYENFKKYVTHNIVIHLPWEFNYFLPENISQEVINDLEKISCDLKKMWFTFFEVKKSNPWTKDEKTYLNFSINFIHNQI